MPQFEIPDSGRQIYVANLLEQARPSILRGAVISAHLTISAAAFATDFAQFTPHDAQQIAAQANTSPELLFATPAILKAAPKTLGYYRSLLGVSQKQFYDRKTGLNVFRTMEESGTISATAYTSLGELCVHLNNALAKLLRALPPATVEQLVKELPLATFGAYADGSWRNKIGTTATSNVFTALKEVVQARGHNTVETASSITVLNNSDREVTLMLAPDPDIVIKEQFEDNQIVYKAAIEIKGGTDYSNLHNRVGEAEKSHQKARASGAGDCWTIIDLKHADMKQLQQESPTTREWFDLSEVLDRSGKTWDRLVQVTRAAMGI